MSENLGQDLGRLFEVGFNAGMLAYIEQNQLQHSFGDSYRQDLQQLSFSKMLRRLADKEKVINEKHRKTVEQWSLFFLQKSFIAGLNFLREYLQSTGWNKRRLKHLEILYYQCYFADDNSMGTYSKGKQQTFQDVLSQLGNNKINIGKYSQKGEFLNADTLVLLKCNRELRVLCIDYSIFSIKSILDLVDINNIEVLRQLLLSEISYLKSKSVFANLGLDVKNTPLNLSESLKRYYTAFKRKDKETIKLIQAASYAHSFSEFLYSQGILHDALSVTYNIVGYSDRGISAMTINKNNRDILATCSNIYKHESKDKTIQDARQEVLSLIKRKAASSFDKGRNFVDKLLNISQDKITLVTHRETIEGFLNPIHSIPKALASQLKLNSDLDLRQAHAELIRRELTSDKTYLFLTGNPGIGKTTAIASFLKSKKCLDEGFLLFYVSPRKQVNLDIIKKFVNPETNLLWDDRLFAINTNSELIKNNNGRCTVQYVANNQQSNFKEQTVYFIDGKEEFKFPQKLAKSLKRVTEDRIEETGSYSRGVLDSICAATYTLINRNISNNIIATVSIQSLKKTMGSKDTLEHFSEIFKDAYNEREGKVIPSQMTKISRRIKHIFIMIDEITGDRSGVEFLKRMSQILRQYELTNRQYGFNTKIIVADASIVDPDVIEQHLSETAAEPNKIFFRKARNCSAGISVQPFRFNNVEAAVINTNSYPANRLNITYKVFLESIKFDNNKYLTRQNSLIKCVQSQIIQDIEILIAQPDSGQIIVYIQDKSRLADLIEKIRDLRGSFQKYQDYLEIHASLSELDKKQIHQYQNQVKVIFMTASASRGLSFPKTKHILVDIPRFEVEQNLMEVIQVIYRGRGYYEAENEQKTLDSEDKELIIYLSEQAIYWEENRYLANEKTFQELSLQESVLNLLNVLLILKTSIMTRIFGSGQIGRDRFIVIPIGGKSVFSAGQTFSSKMKTLIKQLRKEYQKNRSNIRLQEVSDQLEKLLGSAEIVLQNTPNSFISIDSSYLQLRETLTSQFSKIINNNFAGLLDFTPIQTGYINGSLLIVPVTGRAIQERYRIHLEKDIATSKGRKLWRQLNNIRCNPDTPENLSSAVKEAMDLLNLLTEKPHKTQRLEQESQYEDFYYTLPLFTFISYEAMSQYFASHEVEPEDQRFRDILEMYLRSLYPVSDILPLSHQYKEFPFLVFRSYSFKEMRSKLFTDRYFLNSNELNVLSLILSQDC